jgi:hypothetical protein
VSTATRHPIIAGHVEAFEEPTPLGTGPLEPEACDDLAPLVTADDLELEDLLWQRGNDWMTERDVQAYESGMRARDFF